MFTNNITANAVAVTADAVLGRHTVPERNNALRSIPNPTAGQSSRFATALGGITLGHSPSKEIAPGGMRSLFRSDIDANGDIPAGIAYLVLVDDGTVPGKLQAQQALGQLFQAILTLSVESCCSPFDPVLPDGRFGLALSQTGPSSGLPRDMVVTVYDDPASPVTTTDISFSTALDVLIPRFLGGEV